MNFTVLNVKKNMKSSAAAQWNRLTARYAVKGPVKFFLLFRQAEVQQEVELPPRRAVVELKPAAAVAEQIEPI